MRDLNIHIRRWPGQLPPKESELVDMLSGEGLGPARWSGAAGFIFAEHRHAYHKLLIVVAGAITFGLPVDDTPTTLTAGDRLFLPAGTPHNAVVGPAGVICLEAHLA